jgi:tubulin epsilon
LIVRGPKVEISDITRNVEKLQKRLTMVGWNKEGFKVGHCYQAPLNQPYSLLALSNNTCTRQIMQRLRERFMKIYKAKVFVHHYTEFMDISGFDMAVENCTSVIESY